MDNGRIPTNTRLLRTFLKFVTPTKSIRPISAMVIIEDVQRSLAK